jgi:thiol peroxidase
MAQTMFKGTPATTQGELPKVGAKSPDFKLVRNDLSEVSLSTFAGKYKVISIFPSVDTGVCAASVRKFNQESSRLKNAVVLNVSMDLPFAQKRFCGAEGIQNVETLSAFRSSFAQDFGVKLTNTPLSGLCARAVLVLGPDNSVLHSELVSEITQEPNYEAALKTLL